MALAGSHWQGTLDCYLRLAVKYDAAGVFKDIWPIAAFDPVAIHGRLQSHGTSRSNQQCGMDYRTPASSAR
jgi:hypothetical protein